MRFSPHCLRGDSTTHQDNLIKTQWHTFLPALPDLGGALAPAYCAEERGSSRFPGGLQVLSERIGGSARVRVSLCVLGGEPQLSAS